MITKRTRSAYTLMCAAFACATVLQGVQQATAQVTLISHWPFDDAAGSGVAVDPISGNNGAVSGATQGVDGKFGTAIFFDGNTDFVDFGDLADFEFAAGESFSMAFWFKATDTGTFGLQKGDFHKSAAGDFPVYTVRVNGNSTNGVARIEGRSNDAGVYNSTGAYKLDAADAFDDQWHHLAGVYDGATSQFSVYVDGQLSETSAAHPTATAWGTNDSRLFAGREEYQTGSVYGTGSMDDVAVWSGALTDQEVADQYALGIPEPGSLLLSALAGLVGLGLFGRRQLTG